MHDSERHQQLTLVLVDALGLHVENRRRDRCRRRAMRLTMRASRSLFSSLMWSKLGLETLVVGELLDPMRRSKSVTQPSPMAQSSSLPGRDSPASAIAAA